MNYYFPGYLRSDNVSAAPPAGFDLLVNSGKNALRLLLRDLKLAPKSKVAVPAYTCAAVFEAIEEEGLIAVHFDLYPNGSYWTKYDTSRLTTEGIRAVILIHSYGFLHPDTQSLVVFCRKENIRLVHDAAQSYGIPEALLGNNPILYSFGSGKSLTAAGGGWVKGVNKKFYEDNCQGIAHNYISKRFIQSRIFNYKYSLTDKIEALFKKNVPSGNIQVMSQLAQKVNAYALSIHAKMAPLRKRNYEILKKTIATNPKLSIPYDDGQGQYFKVILFAAEKSNELRAHLRANNVPFFSPFDPGGVVSSNLSNFKINAGHFVELSCEACLPQQEIERVASVLGNF